MYEEDQKKRVEETKRKATDNAKILANSRKQKEERESIAKALAEEEERQKKRGNPTFSNREG